MAAFRLSTKALGKSTVAIDNHPKVRQQEQLKRKLLKRPGHDRILIVSEGSKTEPLYFEEIRSSYRLRTADIHVHHSEIGTQPIQVVDFAKDLFINGDTKRRIQRRSFEQVYAVFDRDEHQTYFDALRRCESFDGKLLNDTKKPIKFRAIASVPCFELWLLLHYDNILSPLDRDEALRRLRAHMPEYAKGSNGTFSNTKDRINTAIERADRLATRFSADSVPEPYTAVSELVKVLTNLG